MSSGIGGGGLTGLSTAESFDCRENAPLAASKEIVTMSWRSTLHPRTASIINEFEADTELLREMLEASETSTTVPRNRMYTRPYPGHVYVKEIMNGHEGRAYNCFRMSAGSFRQLTELLTQRGVVASTRYMPAEEQVAVFLRVLAQADSYRAICEFFQHSLETVSRNFHRVLRGVISITRDFIKPPTVDTPCSPHIRYNQNFYIFFKDALGEIDGTHISAVVAAEKQNRYRNRKRFVSQNVMAAVNFEREFVFVVAGWEGSAADMRVLRWAVDHGQFTVPTGKYFLVDSGYANTEKFLAPIRGFRYHLSTYRSQEQRHYSGSEELYNHRHAQLRNVVERTFDILKERFKVLTDMKPFAFTIQADIVIACCILHNFISRYSTDDIYMNMEDNDNDEDANEEEHHQERNPVSSAMGDQMTGETV